MTLAWMCNIHGKILRGDFMNISMQVKSFWIDKYPVTNAQFKKFLDGAHYHPQDDLNFLRDWKDGSFPPAGKTSL